MTFNESTESGAPLYRYAARDRPFEFVIGQGQHAAAIEQHITTHIGTPSMVYHELISDMIHLDVHVVAPTEERPFRTLITSGMSDRPMRVPPGADASPYAELLLCLPPEWPLDQTSLEDERYYWPIHWLKRMGRFPHEYDTWLGLAHTIPNGDPPQPFAPDTGLCGMLIFSPILFGQGVATLRIDEQTSITFYSVIPLYKDEMDLKLSRGFDALLDLLEQAHITELVDPRRPVLRAPRRWFGRHR